MTGGDGSYFFYINEKLLMRAKEERDLEKERMKQATYGNKIFLIWELLLWEIHQHGPFYKY